MNFRVRMSDENISIYRVQHITCILNRDYRIRADKDLYYEEFRQLRDCA